MMKEKNVVFDYRESAIEGYNKLLDYLDENNANYEISKSTEAGYVSSIYIKDDSGDTIYRIANHNNGRISDFDETYTAEKNYKTILKLY